MSLDMAGTIDDDFKSVEAIRISKTGSYGDDGRYVSVVNNPTQHAINLQPLTEKELQSLQSGGERVVDARKIYVNDGDLYDISPSDEWSFLPVVSGVFRTVALDNRPWRNYCKIIVSLKDD